MPADRNLGSELDELLRQLDVPVAIGLVQQGHMPTVERMLAEGRTWEDIGAEIGWHPPTLAEWYAIETKLRSDPPRGAEPQKENPDGRA